MSYKKSNSCVTLIAASLIALTLVTTASFNHSYTAFAVSKRTDSSGSQIFSKFVELVSSQSNYNKNGILNAIPIIDTMT